MERLSVSSPLPDDLEDLVQRTIGACISVHSELGRGLLEPMYSRAIAAELQSLGIRYELERSIPVSYRGSVIGHHRLDLLVEAQIVLEVKAVDRLLPVHVAQVISDLRVSGARIGVLMNFDAEVLRNGLRASFCEDASCPSSLGIVVRKNDDDLRGLRAFVAKSMMVFGPS